MCIPVSRRARHRCPPVHGLCLPPSDRGEHHGVGVVRVPVAPVPDIIEADARKTGDETLLGAGRKPAGVPHARDRRADRPGTRSSTRTRRRSGPTCSTRWYRGEGRRAGPAARRRPRLMATAVATPPRRRRRRSKRLAPTSCWPSACCGWRSSSCSRWPRMFFISSRRGTSRRGSSSPGTGRPIPRSVDGIDTQLIRSVIYGLIVTVACLAIGYPLAYAIAFRGGRWKNALLFAVILPFFVSYLIRTLSWKFILADEVRPGDARQGPGDHRRRVPDPRHPDRGDLRAGLQLPAVHGPAVVRLAGQDRPLADRGGRGPLRGPATAFRKVTLPLSLPGVFAGRC